MPQIGGISRKPSVVTTPSTNTKIGKASHVFVAPFAQCLLQVKNVLGVHHVLVMLPQPKVGFSPKQFVNRAAGVDNQTLRIDDSDDIR